MGEAYQIQDQNRPYFLTFQVVGWADIFSRKIYRDIIIESLTFCRREKGLVIFAYVIMTNHVHVIFQSQNGNLSDIIRDFKKFTSKTIFREIDMSGKESRRKWLNMVFEYYAKYNKRNRLRQFWTHENHAVELSTNDMLDSRLEYIHNNPVRAGWVELPQDYLYSSARNYADLQSPMDIDFI